MTINFTPFPKQAELFKAFRNPELREILYGGASNGGKSYALWALMVLSCLQYPGIRIGFCRNGLQLIKINSMSTFFELIQNLKIPENLYNYNQHSGIITFYNKSVIQFISLEYLPGKANYNFGSLLLTFACIEEAQECDVRGKNAIKARLGKWKNKESMVPWIDKETGEKRYFPMKGKIIMTCNPHKGWLYEQFYKPDLDKTLPKNKLFIKSTATDNPHTSQDIIDNLNDLPDALRASLLFGEWEFDSDKTRLIKYDTVLKMYEDVNHSKPINYKPNYYISADIALINDKCIFILWDNLTIIKIYHYKGMEPDKELIRIRDEFNVDPRKIVYDGSGIGGLLEGKLTMSYSLKSSSSPLLNQNYDNIKSQVYFKLAELINRFEIKIQDNTLKEDVIKEIYAIKTRPLDTMESKLQIIQKKDVIKEIGHSPDISDAMAYRMVFEIKPKYSGPTFAF